MEAYSAVSPALQRPCFGGNRYSTEKDLHCEALESHPLSKAFLLWAYAVEGLRLIRRMALLQAPPERATSRTLLRVLLCARSPEMVRLLGGSHNHRHILESQHQDPRPFRHPTAIG